MGARSGKAHLVRTGWRRHAERALARLLGRRVLCAACGRPLFKGLPVVWRGRILLIGLLVHQPLVRVRFQRNDTLELIHAELDLCRTDERPWARPVDV
jgi:hypothetical protein